MISSTPHCTPTGDPAPPHKRPFFPAFGAKNFRMRAKSQCRSPWSCMGPNIRSMGRNQQIVQISEYPMVRKIMSAILLKNRIWQGNIIAPAPAVVMAPAKTVDPIFSSAYLVLARRPEMPLEGEFYLGGGDILGGAICCEEKNWAGLGPKTMRKIPCTIRRPSMSRAAKTKAVSPGVLPGLPNRLSNGLPRRVPPRRLLQH